MASVGDSNSKQGPVPTGSRDNGVKRRPSQADIGKMKVAELREALKSAIGELHAYDETEAELEVVTGGDGEADGDDGVFAELMPSGIPGMLRLILREVRAMRAEREEIGQLRQEFETLKGVVAQQQRFIEQLDNKDRERNIVITGIPEGAEALEGATTDLDKCQKVLSKIGAEDVHPVQISCIGKQEQNRKRPLLIRLDSKNERDGVLGNTKRLKEAGNAYRYIFVKKDTHPSVRREWKRLKDAETTEKQKPENQGCEIELDFKKRELRRNGVVIDRWAPAYFR